MSYSLPKYYFQDIHPDVMDEIMRGMQAALPEPSWEEIGVMVRGVSQTRLSFCDNDPDG